MARINDGFSTTVEFTDGTSGLTVLWEKEISPPGMSGGGANDTTTMRNTTWRTMAPKNLKTLTESTITVAYDPDMVTEMNSLINVNQQIIITFPGAETLTFWGFVDSVVFAPIVEGEQPTADITIVPTNMGDGGSEVAPVIGNTA